MNQPVQLSPKFIPDFFLKISHEYCKFNQVIWLCLPIKNNIVIVIIIFIIMLELHTEEVLDQWLHFLRFCSNKTPQTSRTFRRILAEHKMVVFCSSTIIASIPASLNHYFNFFGIVLNAPTTTGITFIDISHVFFNSLFRLL